MDGTVLFFNENSQRYAVRTEYGITVFDLHDGQLGLKHVVSGQLDDHGDQRLYNRTTGASISVYIEAIQASAEAAYDLCANQR